ncbi:MAG: DUF2059 domain-containing protein [Marinobacter sp.]|uniref:DUF2059 domain-containing protein n=1 Tax=Marinobacter sp. TaxID=50741 RepID=UPI00299CECC3|nr:DUF2059 domain-containing protein [Marinobacter sp.]MDX1755040.1 DUF2059 domain-containing protein [Marinobacter sp.]
MSLSGLTEQVAQIPDSLKAGLMQAQQQGSPIPDATFQAMMRSADRAIVAEDIHAEIRTSLASKLSTADVQKLLRWYESDLGREITEAERQASDPAAYGDMMRQAKSLYGDTRRVKFAEQLDKLIGATDMVMELQKNAGLAVFSAIMLGTQPEANIDLSAYEDQIASEIESTRPAVEQGIVLSFLYSYRNLEMEQLDEYSEFLREPETRRFNNTVIESMGRALEDGIADLARDMARLMGGSLQQS